MRVHIVTNLFHPDELAGASLYTDLARYLKEQGHDVRVTSTFSYYPAWKVREEDRGCKLRDEVFEEIPVRRVRMYVPARPSGARRMLSDLSFLWGLLVNGRHPGWTPEVTLTALPMLSQCLAQSLRKLFQKTPILIVVQDFVVDAALELGILKLPGLSGVLRGVERFALAGAGTIVTISPEMLEKVRKSFPVDHKLQTRLIPNWIHGSLDEEITRQASSNSTRASGELFYSGNLGVKQGLPEFLQDFSAINSDWSLRIHGGGAEFERMTAAVSELSKVFLSGPLEEAAYVAALKSTSACLVTQRAGVGANFLPSKLLPALATGTPVLAVCDAASPLGREVRDGGFGAVIAPGDREGLKLTLRSWAEDRNLLSEMGRKALLRAARYSRAEVLPLYEEELRSLVEGARPGAATGSAEGHAR